MSRAKIGAAAAVIIVVLTGTAYFFTTQRLDAEIRSGVVSRVVRAKKLLSRVASLEAFDIMARAQRFASVDAVGKALAEPDPGGRARMAAEALQQVVAGDANGGKPDFTALVGPGGEVLAADSPLPDTESWKTRFKAVAAALDRGQTAKDIWSYGKSVVKIGVAPVMDPSGGRARGAVIVADALDSAEAEAQARDLGSRVAYFYGDRLVVSSFGRSAAVEGLTRANELAQNSDQPIAIDVGGETYLAARLAPLPLNLEDRQAAAVVLDSLSDALRPVGMVRLVIVLLGLGALLVVFITMVVTSRSILHPAEEIELGVNEIINGNLEHTFKPVGADFDGLANALNVMLARLLGRPEPGEEEFDDQGKPVTTTARVVLDEAVSSRPATISSDAATLALAQEPEADYYRRLFDEYLAARQAAGESTEGIAFDSFVAKLRVNEANLKKRYDCRAVRFRVQTKDGQVTLKPVPIV